MAWLKELLQKNAAAMDNSAEAFLARIGVPEETISFVTTITNHQLKQQIVGYLSKYPQTPSDLLMEKIRPKRQPQNTQEEISLANRFANLEFQKWLLVSLRKSRRAAKLVRPDTSIPDGYLLPSRGVVNFTLIAQHTQSIFDWYTRGILPARQAMQQAQTEDERVEVINEYGVINVNTNIAVLDFDQAIDFSENWHATIAGAGAGLEYFGETKDDIVFGPKWSNPKWAGWTIKQIKTKNNLRAEGNKVGHCVGSYCDAMMDGRTRIFSLRDPSNTPYVTMEVDRSRWHFIQINGNGPKTGNEEPSDNLKAMIGEWMRAINATIEGMDSFDYSNLSYSDLSDDLSSAIYSKLEGFGLTVSLIHWDYDDAYEAVLKELNNGSRYYNNGGRQTLRVAPILAKAALDADIQRLNSMNEDDMKEVAYRRAMMQRKHAVMDRKYFDKMPIEKRKEYVKDYYQGALNDLKRENLLEWKGEPEPQWDIKETEKIVNRAFYYMKEAKEFDSSAIRSFDQLDRESQIRFMSKSIDRDSSIAQIYNTQQLNDEKLFDAWDYFDDEPTPEQDDFANKDEYQEAYAKWIENKDEKEAEAMSDYRQDNLPYCLDDAVVAHLNELLLNTKIKLPQWFDKYFGKDAPEVPTIMWAARQQN